MQHEMLIMAIQRLNWKMAIHMEICMHGCIHTMVFGVEQRAGSMDRLQLVAIVHACPAIGPLEYINP